MDLSERIVYSWGLTTPRVWRHRLYNNHIAQDQV